MDRSVNEKNNNNNLKKVIYKCSSHNKLENIKSNYIFNQIFQDLRKNKLLEIIKYNKFVQAKFNLNLNDYKDYSEKYSTIEIDIIPLKNKFGKFINIMEGEESYYHIYFNGNNEEIKRNYLNKNEKVTKIKIIIGYQVNSFYKLFFNSECIEAITFQKFSRNNINNMSYMFYRCTSLKKLDFINCNSENVKDMSYMFFECLTLKELDLSNFNTKNLTNMRAMFYWCKSLKKLNVSNFNTDNIIDMSYMFSGCSSLEELNLSHFNTDNVTDMRAMFNECLSLKELNIENFDTKKVIDMTDMFERCSEELKKKIRNQNKNIRKEAFY